ncbi:MAG: alpha/beta fold hydrolase [Nanoarchaeota archaeon]|nr:alpha/beta fold hydrolase [Nanoarchaeota archaeon]
MYKKKDAKFIINGKCKIYYWHLKNKKHKQTIVFFTASSLNHSSMINLAEILYSKGYSILLFDQRGSGFSSKPFKLKEYSLDKFSKDLSLILKKENIIKPIIVTYSFGFMPTINYELKTNNVDKIISFFGSHNFSKTISSKMGYYTFQLVLRLSWYALATMNHIKSYLFKTKINYMDHSKDYKNIKKNIVKMFIKDISLSYIRSNHVMAYKNLHTDISQELSKINIPIVNIIGNKDLAVTKKANVFLRNHIKNFKGYCIEDDHHFPLSNPKKAAQIVLENL